MTATIPSSKASAASITIKKLYSVDRQLNALEYRNLISQIALKLGRSWFVYPTEEAGYIYVRNRQDGRSISFYLPPNLGSKFQTKLIVQGLWDNLPAKAAALIPNEDKNRKIMPELSKGIDSIANNISKKLLAYYTPLYESALSNYHALMEQERMALANAQGLAAILKTDLVQDGSKKLPKINYKFSPVPGVNIDAVIKTDAVKGSLCLEGLSVYALQNLVFIIQNPTIYTSP
jgi:hypothetical protein